MEAQAPQSSEFFEEKPRISKAARRAQRRSERAAAKPETKPLKALNAKQAQYLSYLSRDAQVFAVGGAGTGKTYLAARHAIRRLLANEVEQVIIARPTVSKTKHRQGFLPGSLNAKLKPWLTPLVDAFKQETSGSKLDMLMNEGKIEFLSFEHMRGRSIPNAVIILDEAQNCDFGDLRLFLTRVGEGSQVIVCGDLDQVDIEDSGLWEVVDMIERQLTPISAKLVEFTSDDVVRSAIAKEWVAAFESWD